MPELQRWTIIPKGHHDIWDKFEDADRERSDNFHNADRLETLRLFTKQESDEYEQLKKKEYDHPEDCILVAVHTGDGWGLYVEKNGECVADLKWPEVFGDWQNASQLKLHGFRVE